VSGEAIFFYALAAMMIASAAAMVLARNVVHAVLFMVANFVGTAVLYLLLQAPFIAAVQLIVYAGAIMVLFLFVVMLLGARDLTLSEPLGGQRLFGVALIALLGMLLVFEVLEGVPATPPTGVPAAAALPSVADVASSGAPIPRGASAAAPRGMGDGAPSAAAGAFGSPQMIGALLFRDYVLPFELVSILLLAAMLGAVVIARFRGDAAPDAGAEAGATAGGGAP